MALYNTIRIVLAKEYFKFSQGNWDFILQGFVTLKVFLHRKIVPLS